MKAYLFAFLLYGGAALAQPPTSQPQPTDPPPVDDSPTNEPIENAPIDQPIGTEPPPADPPPDKQAAPASTADAEVFFKFDSAELTENGRTALLNLAEQAKDTSGTMLVLGAHADARGTAPYNVALTVRRAESVRDYLTENGYPQDRIVMTMYGEDGKRRESFAQDRRVSATLTAEPLYTIIDRAGPAATAVVWSEPVTIAEIEGPKDKNAPQTAWR
jgi:outer membrane protein OmpA-like peptidoglycan-associated protein